jgi:hypothetical protein
MHVFSGLPMKSVFLQVVEQYSKLPLGRFRVVDDLADLEPRNLRSAVLFVLAVWSWPSVQALRRLTSVLLELELGTVEIVVLDIDCMTCGDMRRLFGRSFPGAGETLWFSNGLVVAELAASGEDSEAAILDYTQRLTRMSPLTAPCLPVTHGAEPQLGVPPVVRTGLPRE